MSNRIIVKFSFIAAVFVFASCHNDVPQLPTPEEVEGFKYCKYVNKDGEEKCESTYTISESDCKFVGELFDDSICTIHCTKCTE